MNQCDVQERNVDESLMELLSLIAAAVMTLHSLFGGRRSRRIDNTKEEPIASPEFSSVSSDKKTICWSVKSEKTKLLTRHKTEESFHCENNMRQGENNKQEGLE